MNRNFIFKIRLFEMFGPRLSAVTLTLCVAVGLKASTVLIQSPEVVKVSEGQTVQFRCVLESSNVDYSVDKYDVHWYLSQDRNHKILSLSVDGEVYRSPGFPERFQLSRDVASNSFTLTIRDLERRDSAVYLCGIWGTVYGNGTRLNVTIANAPVLLQSPSLERVTEGHSARLQCTMRNARVRDTDVHWYRRQQPGQDTDWVLTHEASGSTRGSPGSTDRLQPSRDTSNNSFILTITKVQPSDTAAYYCKVWGDISGNGTQLNVTSPLADPVLIQDSTVSKVSVGETVQLQCAMYNASVSDTDVHWHYQRPGNNSEWVMSQFVNGTITTSRGFHDRFQPSRNVTSNSYILTIVNVSLSDTAVYSCGVWSSIYGAGTQLNVTVANAPVLLQSPSLERVTDGHSARLQCTMRNARVRDTDVHWYRRQLPGQDMERILTHEASGSTRGSPGSTDRLQPSRDTSNNSFILTITKVQPSDTAAYYCKVWGDISGNGTQLNVTSPLADPVLIQDSTVSKVAEGETVQLQCAMYNASVSDTDVHWHYQRPGNNSEWVMSQFVNDTITRSRGFPDRFQPSRNVTSNSYILTIVNVSLSDTAVYSCGVWSYIYGAGTQLNVTVANAPVLLQSPSLERVTEGHSARLQCTMRNARVRDTDVHWYRQLPGQDMEWVLTHEASGSTRGSPGSTDRLQPSRDTSNNSFILTITKMQIDDTAVYYCKVWGDISGNGTQLNVTKLSENWSPTIIGHIAACALVLAILLCIFIAAVFYMKKWACFQSRLKPEGTSAGVLNPVYETVRAETQTNKQEAATSTVLDEGELYYADIQFFRQNYGGPTFILS